jgi:hypothetical protein
MAKVTKGPRGQWAHELREDPATHLGSGVGGADLFTPRFLLQRYEAVRPNDRDINRTSLGLDLAKVFEKRKVKVEGKRSTNLYAIRNPEKWRKASDRAWADHWWKSMTKEQQEHWMKGEARATKF